MAGSSVSSFESNSNRTELLVNLLTQLKKDGELPEDKTWWKQWHDDLFPELQPKSSSSEDWVDDDCGRHDDGGIEEPECGISETTGPITVISHGTDGLERHFQFVIVQRLRRKDVNLDNLDTVLEKLELEYDLAIDQLLITQIKKNIKNVRIELSQMQNRYPNMRLEELKAYYVPLCWSSKKRVDFWSHLSDELLLRADELKKLMLELEKKWQLHFGGKWINGLGQRDFGEKWFPKIDEGWIKRNGRAWIKKTDREWINIIEDDHMPWGSYHIFVRGLLRFVRNRWHHLDKFQESRGLRSVESFYNYFDALFPCLLLVSYGVAHRFCREERWFEEYR